MPAKHHYPQAVDASKGGTYPARTLSGGGHFYDEVLEYRVWVYTDNDGEYCRSFVDYERALLFPKKTEGSKEPVVLVLQREYVDEPEEGVFLKRSTTRRAEWKPEWLQGSKREENSIDQFIAEHSRNHSLLDRKDQPARPLEPIAQSALLQKIQDALLCQQDEHAGIRISITKEVQEIEDAQAGTISRVKSLCWNLIDADGEYLTDPVLTVVHKGLSKAAIRADLRKFFPSRKAIVDNDIYIDDEE